jgi:hypothetical protein
MTSSRHELNLMKKAISKGDMEAFDLCRKTIRDRYGATQSCAFEAMATLGEKMPKGEAEEYSLLLQDAAILNAQNVTKDVHKQKRQ